MLKGSRVCSLFIYSGLTCHCWWGCFLFCSSLIRLSFTTWLFELVVPWFQYLFLESFFYVNPGVKVYTTLQCPKTYLPITLERSWTTIAMVPNLLAPWISGGGKKGWFHLCARCSHKWNFACLPTACVAQFPMGCCPVLANGPSILNSFW